MKPVDAAKASYQALERKRAAVEALGAMGAFDQAELKVANASRSVMTKEEIAAFEAWYKPKFQQNSKERQARLSSIVDQYGWPRISEFGQPAATAAFLVVQHAEHNLEFQEKMLRLIEPLVAREDVSGEHYALLYDRVAVNSNKPQRYASQLNECRNGKFIVPTLLEDPANVDKRRATVGLGPLKDYMQAMDRYSSLCSKSKP
jgi:hypothetical protein